MPSKYKRFLLSACLPLMIAGALTPSMVNAGFEWNAPKKVIPPYVSSDSKEKIETVNDNYVFEVIEGFGTDMPLALVLRQIVPAKYAFSFDESVDLGAIISWKGGKAWNIVLEDAIAPLNIVYEINGNKLKLSKLQDVFIGNDDVTITPIIDIDGIIGTEKKKQLY